MTPVAPSPWKDAVTSACLFAIAPSALGGIVLRAPAGPVRDAWVAILRRALAPAAPVRRVPLNITDSRLLGGLDLAATLQAGRPVLERGLLADAHGGVILLAMAERISSEAAARFTGVIDSCEVNLERDGMTSRYATQIGVVAFDEGCTDEERPPAALLDRLAMHHDLSEVSSRDTGECPYGTAQLVQARAQFPAVVIEPNMIEALCATAMALGVRSLRTAMLACVVARASAALCGRAVVVEEDAVLAGRLVLAPRATCLPATQDQPDDAAPDADAAASPEDPETSETPEECQNSDQPGQPSPPEDVVLEATRAAIPPDLLARLAVAATAIVGPSSGRAGALQKSMAHGRSAGIRRGDLKGNVRLHVLETLRAAAPWQMLRMRQRMAFSSVPRASRIDVRHEDFHVKHFVQRTQTTTVFVVDASGSAALHRLAETKGAVELLLAECYARRDRVAVVSFRHHTAELLLAPTRSLVRAKRTLSALPAGGGTPLAAAMDAAAELAEGLKRRGDTPIIVFLSDGRANVARDGSHGRERAEGEAMQAATRLKLGRITSLFIDTSRFPAQLANQLAAQMGASYLALPNANSATLCAAVRTISQ